MTHKNKSKILKIFCLSLIGFSNFSFIVNLTKKNDRFSFTENNFSGQVNSDLAKNKNEEVDIEDLITIFP